MKSKRELPSKFPVRYLEGKGWEVLIEGNEDWFKCEDEYDARIIARGQILEFESLEQTRTGLAFAAELDEVAFVFRKYKMGFGSRFFSQCAEDVRRAC